MYSLLDSLSAEDIDDLDTRLNSVSSGRSDQGTSSYLFDELLLVAHTHRELFKPVFDAHGLEYDKRVGLTGRMGLSEIVIAGLKLEFNSLSSYWGGDPDSHWFTIPLRYLLPDGKERMARDAKLLSRGMARVAAAKAKRLAIRKNAEEKALLLKLLAKHGLPKEFQHG